MVGADPLLMLFTIPYNQYKHTHSIRNNMQCNRQREQLTNIDEPYKYNVLFGKSIVTKVPDSDRTYDRIPITVDYKDNVFGPLLLKTDKCYSYGARQNFNKETGEAYGWTLPIVMFDKEGATDHQLKLVKYLDNLIMKAKNRVLDEYPIDDEAINKLGGCMWQPNHETKGPILYAKIISAQNGNTRYDSRFSRVKDISNPTKRERVTKEKITESCYVQAVIRVHSIYVCEGKAYLQVKVYEANVQKLEELPSYL